MTSRTSFVRQKRHENRVKKNGRNPVHAKRRSLGLETLENRLMLTVSQDIVSQLTPYQNALNNALDVMTSLPLVGDQLSGAAGVEHCLSGLGH